MYLRTLSAAPGSLFRWAVHANTRTKSLTTLVSILVSMNVMRCASSSTSPLPLSVMSHARVYVCV